MSSSRMVSVDMKVSIGLDGHVNQGMARQLINHMVQETNTGHRWSRFPFHPD